MLPKSLALCVPADTCVTVVDASMFLKHLHNAKQLNETELAKGMEEAQESQELICQLMANQIEYADVIALNKTDLLLPDDVKDVNKAVKALNPKAKVIPCTYGEVPPYPHRCSVCVYPEYCCTLRRFRERSSCLGAQHMRHPCSLCFGYRGCNY